jgi:hypothetical protein
MIVESCQGSMVNHFLEKNHLGYRVLKKKKSLLGY